MEKNHIRIPFTQIDKVESMLNNNNAFANETYNRLLAGLIPLYKEL